MSAEAAEALKPKMFCYQCEQTANHTGCSVIGQCGKSPEVAGLQDLTVFSLKGLASLAHYARGLGISDHAVDSFILKAAFSTLTNVNFDDSRFVVFINHGLGLHSQLAAKIQAAGHPLPAPPAGTPWFESATGHPLAWNAQAAARLNGPDGELSLTELIELSKRTGILGRQEVLGKTLAGLQELVMYGLKGVAAYAAHAEALGGTDPKVYASVNQTLTFLSSPDASDPGKVLAEALRVGETNMRVMELLSNSHSGKFGHPVPTEVSTIPTRPGKCILVTGHDMQDIYDLLVQTEGTGIDVYTHGEMLPAHSYPALKKFKHLAGHFGGAWYRQKMDFSYWPGAIVATTNCVLEPMSLYRQNLFTKNETGLSNVGHVSGSDFSAVIARAQALPGWKENTLPKAGSRGMPNKSSVTVGFGHNAVLGVADKVVGAINEGKLKHIFLVGGCDGHEPQRAYYGGLGQHLPKDTMLLTLGCGKFRLIDQEFGTLADTGLPRLLDMGQCNDAYSALVVATELAKAFKTDINSLPLSLDLSWFEQKAVAVLLTLLHLGVTNIRLGPALPAFLTPEALDILVTEFKIQPADVSNPEEDLAKMMARA